MIKSKFRRDRLPSGITYFAERNLKLAGKGAWRDALCPFHDDTKPSLRVKAETGAYRCMACGAHGGDILTFHIGRTGLPFIEAAKDLRAWQE